MGLHQRIHLEGAGVAARLIFPDVVIEVIGVGGTEQAAARPGRQPPYDLVVCVTLSPCPAHLHQRIAIDKQRLLALLGPPSFLPHDTHVEGMGVYVQRQSALPGLVAQQLIAHKFFNDFDLGLEWILPRSPSYSSRNYGNIVSKTSEKIRVVVVLSNTSPFLQYPIR